MLPGSRDLQVMVALTVSHLLRRVDMYNNLGQSDECKGFHVGKGEAVVYK